MNCKGGRVSVLIPHPKFFQLCKQSREQAICINVACVASSGVGNTAFYVEKLGLLSGTLGDREDDVRARYEMRGLEFNGFDKMTVPASTLNAILSENLPPDAEIDFISIDVEGTELEVLQGLDLSRFRPRVLVIEANSEEAKETLQKHVVQLNGYVEARSLGPNLFYARSLEDADKLRAISIDCQIEKHLHPLGKKYTLKEFIEGKVIRHHDKVRRTRASAITRMRDKLFTLIRSLVRS